MRQRECLCVLHDFFPQEEKIGNCLTNNALRPSRNNGMCIHLMELKKAKIKELEVIQGRVQKYLDEKRYLKEKGEISLAEKQEVLESVIQIINQKMELDEARKKSKEIRDALGSKKIGKRSPKRYLFKSEDQLMKSLVPKNINKLLKLREQIAKVKVPEEEKIKVIDVINRILDGRAKYPGEYKIYHYQKSISELKNMLKQLTKQREILKQRAYPSTKNRQTHLKRNATKIRHVKKAILYKTNQT